MREDGVLERMEVLAGRCLRRLSDARQQFDLGEKLKAKWPAGEGRLGPNSGFIYAIDCSQTGLVKLGATIDPEKRLATLQVGSAPELRLRGWLIAWNTKTAERAVHRYFDRCRVRGEWFRIPSGDLDRLLAKSIPELHGLFA